jgi:protein gp37
MKDIEIARLRMDGGTQPRAELDRKRIDLYADLLREGIVLPPVVVFHSGADYWLSDGFHRVNAAKLAGRARVPVDVRQGARRDAVLFSCGANREHDAAGLPRSNADKRRAVETLLRDDEWVKWSDREIAKRCAVAQTFVSGIRRSLSTVLSEPAVRTFVSKHGTTTTMKTENIGRRAKSDETDEAPELPSLLSHVLPASEIKASQDAASAESETKFNRTNSNVEWALWTWNPVTGCLHDCTYCYARDIANRFYPEKFEPTYRPERLKAPERTPAPSPALVAAPFDELAVRGGIGEKNVFVCSMADLFGKWVPAEWIDAVMAEVRAAPQWNFLFLTKFPQRLVGIDFPNNAWVGTTVDTQARVAAAETAFAKIKAGVKWLSCEPMLERLTFGSLSVFDWVVIGGQSRSSQEPEFKPPLSWVGHLQEQAVAAGCKVYMKTNLLAPRVREYPSQKATR